MKKICISLPIIILTLSLLSCGPTTTDDITQTEEPSESSSATDDETQPEEPPLTSPSIELLSSDKPRVTSPEVSEAELETQVDGNTAFALDLYQALKDSDDNILYSPYSISIALAMAYAGALGQTAEEMANTLHYALPQSSLHQAFNALDIALSNRGKDREDFSLNIANAMWGQKDFEFLPDFLDILAQHYGAGLGALDFRNEPEQSSRVINEWASYHTEGKITNIIPPGAITKHTRFILTNAIYFKADWINPFDKSSTRDDIFHLLNGDEITVPMMKQTDSFGYAEGESYQAVKLVYKGNELSMVIILPEDGQFETFEASLDVQRLNEIIDNLYRHYMRLTMPKFTFEVGYRLSETLATMGMPSAFSNKTANFEGMAGVLEMPLYIHHIFHKAFIAVDEKGHHNR